MSPVVWWIVLVLAAIAVLDFLIVSVDSFYVILDGTLFALLSPVLPTLRPALARIHMRRMLKRSARDTAVNFARRVRQERLLLQVAEEEAPVAEAARYARDLGLGAEAERLWAAAIQEDLQAGREASAIALAMEGKMTSWLAAHYESRGDLRAAGDQWVKASRPRDAARCFEAAGEWYRAAQELTAGNHRVEVEALLTRCRDPIAVSYARGWLARTGSGASS